MHCARLVDLDNEKANPQGRLQNQQNHCLPKATVQRLPAPCALHPVPCTLCQPCLLP